MTAPTVGVAEPYAGWREPRLAHQTVRTWTHRLMIVSVGILVLIGAVMDAQLMQPALNHVLRGAASHVAFVSYVIGILMAVMMARAGWLLRGALCEPARRGQDGLPCVLLISLWAVVGVLIAVVRWHASGLAAQSVGYDGAEVAAEAGQSAAAHLAAMMFLGVYLATGILALVDLYGARNDVFTLKMTACAELRTARQLLHEDEARQHRLAYNLRNAVDYYAMITGEGALAKEAQQALVDRLKQLALIRLGTDTASTAVLGVASTNHPLNPRAARPTADGADAG